MQTLKEVLAALPDIELQATECEVPDTDVRWDAVFSAQVKGQPVRFYVEARTSGYPRDMQQALWQLTQRSFTTVAPHAVPMVVAPAISDTSRALLRAQGVAYADGGGSVHIDLPWAFYHVDRPVPAAVRRSLQNIYRGSSAQVLHALLLDVERAWHLTALAERAEVAVSTTHQVCRFLEEQLWMEQRGSGPRSVRLLREPGKLLDAWSAAHSLEGYIVRRYYRWTSDPRELTQAVAATLDAAGIDYALTLSSGAQFVAPHASGLEHVWALVPQSALQRVEALKERGDLEPVEDGAVVDLFLTSERTPFLFRHQVQGFWVASDVQLYLDLSVWPRRGKEQAQHLRLERMGY